MASVLTSHPVKPLMQVPAAQIPINHVLDIMPEKPVLPFISVIPDHLQVFKMRLYISEIMGLARMARFIDIIFF